MAPVESFWAELGIGDDAGNAFHVRRDVDLHAFSLRFGDGYKQSHRVIPCVSRRLPSRASDAQGAQRDCLIPPPFEIRGRSKVHGQEGHPGRQRIDSQVAQARPQLLSHGTQDEGDRPGEHACNQQASECEASEAFVSQDVTWETRSTDVPRPPSETRMHVDCERIKKAK